VPYHHNGCKGQIRWYPLLPVRPKCRKCGKEWSFLSVYSPQPPNDMTYVFESSKKLQLKKGNTSYASWADAPYTPPGVSFVASNLPNWPRKWRLTAFLGSITFLSGAFYGLYLISFWAVIFGAIGFAIISLIVAILLAVRG
jgi:hypothetical protein